LLTAVAAKRSERAETHSARLVALQVEADPAKERLQRLYALIEDGLAEMDGLLRERISILKADREKAQGGPRPRAERLVARLLSTRKDRGRFQTHAGRAGQCRQSHAQGIPLRVAQRGSRPGKVRITAAAKRFMRPPRPPIPQEY
jgi:hypothetical protein